MADDRFVYPTLAVQSPSTPRRSPQQPASPDYLPLIPSPRSPSSPSHLPSSSPRTRVGVRQEPSSPMSEPPGIRIQRGFENRSRESLINNSSDHINEAIEDDHSLGSTHEWIPPLPHRKPPSVAQQSPDFGPKPDFLHSRNLFAKQGPPDPYVESGAVVGLNKKTFKKFIRDLDAALVLFYNPMNKSCCSAKVNVRQAAHVTRRENHAFAAVDCSKEEMLCWKEKVYQVPTMKLYVKGMTVNTYRDENMLPEEIRQLVEKAPLVSETVVEKNRCLIQ